ncbi:6-phosphogluconate dehydrogenase, partial [Xylariales sp. PMI_506]
TVAILSMGEMGMGIATLLSKFQYPIVTNLDGRSEKTQARADAIGVRNLSLAEILKTASIILSIVPPGEAQQLAQRFADLCHSNLPVGKKIAYIDLNALSPTLARQIGSIVSSSGLHFIDGAVIGFPPRELNEAVWFRPSIPLSGPPLGDVLPSPWLEQLSSILKFRHVGDTIGAASGLKMCFGAIYKGHAAVTTQAYTTATSLGVLHALQDHLAEYFPTTQIINESAILGSQRKSYRWIKEMEEIAETFAQDGGWNRDLFAGVAEVFRVV